MKGQVTCTRQFVASVLSSATERYVTEPAATSSNGHAGVAAIPESASGELKALESGTLCQSGLSEAPEHAELGTQTSNSLAENT